MTLTIPTEIIWIIKAVGVFGGLMFVGLLGWFIWMMNSK